MNRHLLIQVLLALFPLAQSSETDSFTFRHKLLDPTWPAVTPLLNTLTNARMQSALDRLNTNSKGHCASRLDLEREINRAVGDVSIAGVNTMQGAIEIELNQGRSTYVKFPNGTEIPLPVLKTETSQHIYSVFDAIWEKGWLTSGKVTAFVNVKVNDTHGRPVVIGSDKTAHFFSQGMEYLTVYRAYLNRVRPSTLSPDFVHKQAMQRVVEFGVETEMGKYGFGFDEVVSGTGIFSYADLATNFAGLQFWTRLIPLNGSATGGEAAPSIQQPVNVEVPPLDLVFADSNHTLDPYFDCVNGKWIALRPFQWEELVTPAWDENINANEFRSEQMKSKFMTRIRELYEQQRLPRDSFPMDPSLCQELGSIAPGSVLPSILNPSCFAFVQ